MTMRFGRPEVRACALSLNFLEQILAHLRFGFCRRRGLRVTFIKSLPPLGAARIIFLISKGLHKAPYRNGDFCYRRLITKLRNLALNEMSLLDNDPLSNRNSCQIQNPNRLRYPNSPFGAIARIVPDRAKTKETCELWGSSAYCGSPHFLPRPIFR